MQLQCNLGHSRRQAFAIEQVGVFMGFEPVNSFRNEIQVSGWKTKHFIIETSAIFQQPRAAVESDGGLQSTAYGAHDIPVLLQAPRHRRLEF